MLVFFVVLGGTYSSYETNNVRKELDLCHSNQRE